MARTALDPTTIGALRHALWQGGFHPIPIINAVLGDKETGKMPAAGKNWQVKPSSPPLWVTQAAVSHALNTGIVCNGLRAIDFDIDDADLAAQCLQLALEMLPPGAPVRYRIGSARCLMLFRAAEGEPHKITLAGREGLGKIEILGRGNQFVAYGQHWESLAELQWRGELRQLAELPAVTEPALFAFLTACAPLLEAEAPRPTNGHDGPHAGGEPQADPWRIALALAAIPNTGPADWDKVWNRVGMATWAATGGSERGFVLWDLWSSQHPTYDPAACRARWQHYFTSPPTNIGAGTIFHLAAEARAREGPREDVPPVGEPPGDADATIPFRTFSEMSESSEPADFIEDLLTMGALSVIYGATNSGKSFFALDLAMHVVAKPTWREQYAIDRGAVIYIALEGGNFSINNRVVAIKQREGWDSYDLPFAAITTSINLRNPDAHVAPLIATVAKVAERFAAAECPVRWIIVDTLSRALAGGNENSSEDMGALVINCDRVRATTGCHLSLIHHSGKDEAKGARGHSLLTAATDTEIEIVNDDGTRTVTITKQRDVQTIAPFAFRLKQVEIGTNHRGKPITSCLVEYAGSTSTREERQQRRRTEERKQRADDGRHKDGVSYALLAKNILADLLVEQGQHGYAGVPHGLPSVTRAAWRDAFYSRTMVDPKTNRNAFIRAADTLVTHRQAGVAGERVWLCYDGKEIW